MFFFACGPVRSLNRRVCDQQSFLGFARGGALEWLDAVSVHAYTRSMPEDTQAPLLAVRALLSTTTKAPPPLVVTEWGYWFVCRGSEVKFKTPQNAKHTVPSESVLFVSTERIRELVMISYSAQHAHTTTRMHVPRLNACMCACMAYVYDAARPVTGPDLLT